MIVDHRLYRPTIFDHRQYRKLIANCMYISHLFIPGNPKELIVTLHIGLRCIESISYSNETLGFIFLFHPDFQTAEPGFLIILLFSFLWFDRIMLQIINFLSMETTWEKTLICWSTLQINKLNFIILFTFDTPRNFKRFCSSLKFMEK